MSELRGGSTWVLGRDGGMDEAEQAGEGLGIHISFALGWVSGFHESHVKDRIPQDQRRVLPRGSPSLSATVLRGSPSLPATVLSKPLYKISEMNHVPL